MGLSSGQCPFSKPFQERSDEQLLLLRLPSLQDLPLIFFQSISLPRSRKGVQSGVPARVVSKDRFRRGDRFQNPARRNHAW